MPQSERNRKVAFMSEQVMEAVLRMTNLFEEFNCVPTKNTDHLLNILVANKES